MKTFKNTSRATKAEFAIKMTILDAIEKGRANKEELAEYMQTERFEKAASRYMKLMK